MELFDETLSLHQPGVLKSLELSHTIVIVHLTHRFKSR